MLSMTGFGCSSCTKDGVKISVQITSFNRKQTDVRIKLPGDLAFLEINIRNRIVEKISRGAIQVKIEVSQESDSNNFVKVDIELARQIYSELERLKNELQLDGKISIDHLLQIQNLNILKIQEFPEEKLEEMVIEAVNEALEKLISAKKIEGNQLKSDIRSRHIILNDYLQNIKAQAPKASEINKVKYHSRIKKMVSEINVDDDRLMKEIAIQTDRYDITEECTRLTSHLDLLGTIFEVSEPVGRKMDFLIQECFREINTIASKCNDLDIAKVAIDFKTELERIREQVQNIE